jgi:hypothetical protein
MEMSLFRREGESHPAGDMETLNMSKRERFRGGPIRSISLPDDAESSKVNEQFKEGASRLHSAKSENARPRSSGVKINLVNWQSTSIARAGLGAGR